MVDLELLYWLSGSVNIHGHEYWVTWNIEKQEAEVLKDGGKIASFPYELAAHQYIMDIASLDQTKDKDAWRRITEQQDEAETTG